MRRSYVVLAKERTPALTSAMARLAAGPGGWAAALEMWLASLPSPGAPPTAAPPTAAFALAVKLATDAAPRGTAAALARHYGTVPGAEWDERALTATVAACTAGGDLATARTALAMLAGPAATEGAAAAASPEELRFCPAGSDSPTLRRRALGPWLQQALADGDRAGAAWATRLAAGAGVELAEADFVALLALFPAQRDAVLDAMQGPVPVVSDAAAERLLGALVGDGSRGAVEEATVDRAGVCGCCGEALQSFPFPPHVRATLLAELREKLPQVSRNARNTAMALETFRRFVQQYQPDCIIDGANLGYYGLTSWYADAKEARYAHQLGSAAAAKKQREAARLEDGRDGDDYRLECLQGGVDVPVDLTLVDRAVEEAKAAGLAKRPLVVLHSRHMEDTNLYSANAAVAARWREQRHQTHVLPFAFYCTPPRVNDDVLWLYASLQLAPTAAAGHAVPRGPLVVTNDAMRDHHFAMLSPRPFFRWRQRHRVGFTCARDHAAGTTKVVLHPPLPHDAVVQRSARTGRWHVPLSIPTDTVRGGECAGPSAAAPNAAVEAEEERVWLCIE